MSWSSPPILGVRPEPVPMIVVRKQPAPNQRWGVCTICRAMGRVTRFMLPEESAAYERHFHACAGRNMEQLRSTETLAGKNPTLFGPTSGDVELRQWIDRNREALLEDRKRIS